MIAAMPRTPAGSRTRPRLAWRLLDAGDAGFLRTATLLAAGLGFLPLVWASRSGPLDPRAMGHITE